MTDESESRSLGQFTADQFRKLLNLLDVADQLETFSKSDKEALGVLIQDHSHLHVFVESRKFWANVRKKSAWLVVQIGAFIGAIAGLNEAIQHILKWRHG